MRFMVAPTNSHHHSSDVGSTTRITPHRNARLEGMASKLIAPVVDKGKDYVRVLCVGRINMPLLVLSSE